MVAMKVRLITGALAAALAASIAYTPTPAQAGAGPQAKQSERIYGYGMMSEAERNEYRDRMRGTSNETDRQALRDEHRSAMDARMKERGVEPGQMHGRGAGPHGPGYGQGKGGGPGAPAQK